MTSPAVCEHGRTGASCEACAHAAALADPRRAPVTRDALYPFPEGGPLQSGFLADKSSDESTGLGARMVEEELRSRGVGATGTRSRKKTAAKKPAGGETVPLS